MSNFEYGNREISLIPSVQTLRSINVQTNLKDINCFQIVKTCELSPQNTFRTLTTACLGRADDLKRPQIHQLPFVYPHPNGN